MKVKLLFAAFLLTILSETFAQSTVSVSPTSFNVNLGCGASTTQTLTVTNTGGGSLTYTAAPTLIDFGAQFHFGYVLNTDNNNVSVINLLTNTVVGSPINVGNFPWKAAIRPDAKFVYVSNRNSNDISIIRTSDNTVVSTVFIGGEVTGIAFTKDSKFAYVCDKTGGQVFKIDCGTLSMHAITGSNLSDAMNIVITPDGLKAYVGTQASGVTIIDLQNELVIGNIPMSVVEHVMGITITPDGQFVYASGVYSNNVIAINTQADTVVASISGFNNPTGMDVSSDGAYVYAVDRNNKQLVKISTSNNTVVNSISDARLDFGHDVVVSADGHYAHWVNTFPNNTINDVMVIDLLTNTVVSNISTGSGVRSIVNLKKKLASFVSLGTSAGTIPFSGNNVINVTFDASGIFAGTYTSTINISVTSSVQPIVSVPCTLTITGSPAITLTPTCLNYGAIFQFGVSKKTVYLTNPGCDSLKITSLVSGDPAYTVDYAPAYILPTLFDSIVVKFNPVTLGTFNSTLVMHSNLPDTSICLTGSTLAPPTISVTPPSIAATVSCGDSAVTTLTIHSTGASNLTYTIPSLAPVPLAACGVTKQYSGYQMEIFNVQFNTINNSSGVGPGTGLEDFTSIRTSVSAGNTYAFHVSTGNNYYENVNAWIDFNNSGTFEASEQIMSDLSHYINHDATVTIPLNAVQNRPLRLRIGADYNGSTPPGPCTGVTYGGYEDYTVLIDPWINGSPSAGSIVPAGTNVISVHLTSMHLPAGIHRDTLFINSNDPLHLITAVPIAFTVNGFPQMTFPGGACLVYDTLFQYGTSVMPWIVNNPGCDTLKLLTLTPGNADFSISSAPSFVLPFRSDTVFIQFNPQNSGAYNSTMLFHTNLSDSAVCLRGFVKEPPLIDASPTSFNVSLSCGASTTQTLTIHNVGDNDLIYSTSASAVDLGSAFHFGYACNSQSSTVTVFNTSSNTVVGSPIAVGSFPWRAVVRPDAKFVYVLNRYGNSISIINTQTNVVDATISLGAEPAGIAFTPDSKYAYVSFRNFNGVKKIKCSDNSILATITGSFDDAREMAITPNGLWAYVTTMNSGVSIINLSTDVQDLNIGTSIIPGSPHLVISPDGQRVYFSSRNSNSVKVLSTATNTVIATISGSFNTPQGIDMTNDGSTVYMVERNGGSHLYRISTATNTVSGTLSDGHFQNLVDVKLSSDNQYAYVASQNPNNSNEDIMVVKLSTFTVVGTLQAENEVRGLATLKKELAPFMTLSPEVDTIAPAGTQAVTVTFDAANLAVGTYHSTITINSNDPTNPVVTIPSTLTVTGFPAIALSDTCMVADTIYQFTSTVDTLYLTNTGCDSLLISSITAGNPAFSVLSSPSHLAPYGGNGLIIVQFAPTTIGPINSVLVIHSNIADTSVCLKGESLSPPHITTNPTSLSATLTCGGSTTQTLNIMNSGNTNLTYNTIYGMTDYGTMFKYGYVCNSGDNDVFVIDQTTNTIVGSPIAIGGTPWRADIRPDGRYVYVCGRDNSTVYVINTATNAVDATISVGNTPIGVTFTHDSKFAYVCHRNDSYIAKIDCETNTVVATFSGAFNDAHDIVITPDNQSIYVGTFGSGVSKVNLSNQTVTATIPYSAASGIRSMSITPNGQRIYAASRYSNTVKVINTTTNLVIASIGGFNEPQGQDMSADGAFVYIVDHYGSKLFKISTASNTIVATLSDARLLHGTDAKLSSNEQYVYVTVRGDNNPSEDVIIVDRATFTILGTLSTGSETKGGLVMPGHIYRSFVTLNPSSGTVAAPSGSNPVTVTFSADSLATGVHTENIYLYSNDPSHPVDTVVATITVTGFPIIALSDTCMVADTIFQNATTIDTLVIHNTGCDSLHISSIVSGNPAFTVISSPTGLAPFVGSGYVVVQFAPLTAGPFSSTLVIHSNTADTSVCLNGFAKSPPHITINPTSFNVNVSCNGSTTSTLNIGNTGNTDLIFTADPGTSNYGTLLHKGYTCNSGSSDVTVFDMSNNSVITTVSVGNFPWRATIRPDGKFVYVLNRDDNTISVINTATNVVDATINVASSPAGIAFTRNSKYAYVSHRNSNVVKKIRCSDNTVIADINGTFNDAREIAITPDGSKAFVCTMGNGVSVIDLTTDVQSGTTTYSNYPGVSRIVISPNGQRAYISSRNSNSVRVMNTSNNALVTTIGGGFNSPQGLDITKDGLFLYVTDHNQRLYKISTASNTVVSTLSDNRFNSTTDVSLSYDEHYAYVASQNPSVSTEDVIVVDLNTFTIVGTISAGNQVRGLATPKDIYGSFMSLSSSNDTVHASGNDAITVTFDANGILAGTYNASILIYSNDPLSSIDTVFGTMTVTGFPFLTLSDTCFAADTVFQNAIGLDTLMLGNTGCDTLFISSISSGNSAFTVVSSPSYIAPQSATQAVVVQFAPLTTGTFNSTLVIHTNLPDTAVCLRGFSRPPPVITSNPTLLNVSLGCSATETDTITFHNTGFTNLDYHVDTSNYCAVLDGNNFFSRPVVSLPSGGTALTAEAWIYPTGYPDGTWNGILSWGTRNCNGNMLFAIQNDGRMSFANWCNDFIDGSGPAAVLNQWNHVALVLDGTNVTFYVNGVSSSSTVNSTAGIVSQNLTIGCTDYPGRFFQGRMDEVRVWNFARSQSQILASMNSQLNGHEPGLVSYWNFNNQDGNDLASTGNNTSPSGGITYMYNSPISNGGTGYTLSGTTAGTIVPGDSAKIAVTFNSAGLLVGSYHDTINVISNDPITPNLSIPTTLTVTGIGAISLSATCLAPITVMEYTTGMDSVVIKNTGCDTLHVTSLSTNLSVFTLNTSSVNILPGDSQTVVVTFSPLNVNSFLDTIHVNTTIGNAGVCLHGISTPRPIFTAVPDSFNFSIDACHDSTIKTMTIHNTGGVNLTYSYGSVAWANFTPSGGTILPNDSVVVSATFYKSSFAPGITNTSFTMTTNDPLNFNKVIPVVLNNDTALPSAPTVSDVFVCFGSPVPPFVATGTNIRWYSDAAHTILLHSGNTFNTGETVVGNYTYYVSQNLDTCPGPSAIAVLHISSPAPKPTASDATVCLSNLAPVTATHTGTLLWYSDPGLTNHLFTGNSYNTGISSAAAYVYYVTDSTPGCGQSLSDTLDLLVLASPAHPVAMDSAICIGGTNPQLIATGGSNIQWYSDPTLLTLVNSGPTFTPSQTTAGVYNFYVVEFNSGNGCSSVPDTSTFTINALPVVGVTSNSPVCESGTLNLHALGGVSWNWTGPNSFTSTSQNPSIAGVTTAAAGTYTVTALSAAGCSRTRTISVTVNALPTPTAGSNSPVCVNIPLHLSAGGGVSYEWTGPNGFSSASQNPTIALPSSAATGTYTVMVTNSNNCSSTTTTDVVINPLPVATASSNTPDCVNSTLLLSASGGSTYSWTGPNTFISSNQNDSIVNPTLAATGTYTVTVTTALGCTKKATTTVLMNPLPIAVAGNTGPVCENSSLGLSSGGGSGYAWAGPNSFTSTSQNPTILSAGLNAAGTYTVTVTDGNGCSKSATTTVVINPAPGGTVGSNSPVCVGNTLSLTSSGGASGYAWSGPNSFGDASQNPAITSVTTAATGTYTLTVTGANTCTSVLTVPVTINTLPLPTASSNSTVCANTTLTLNSSGGSGYSWSGPNSFSSSSQNPNINGVTLAAIGTYTVTVTDLNSCSASTTTNVSVYAAPPATAGSNSPVCTNSPLNLNSSGGTGYSWTGPNSFTSTSQTPIISTPTTAASGTYTVTVTDAHNCTATSTTNVTVHSLPVPSGASNSPVCVNDTLHLTSGGGSGYQWIGPNSYNDANQFSDIAHVTTAATGTYTLTVTDLNGCSASTTVGVLVNTLPPAISGSNGPVCETFTLNLTAGGGTGYSWSGPNGFSTSNQNPNITNVTTAATGTYTVTVTDGNSCVSISTTNVTVNVIPPAPASSGTVLCKGNPVPDFVATGTNVQWFSDVTLTNLEASGNTFASGLTDAGTYNYYVTQTVSGCVSAATTVTLTINALPLVTTNTSFATILSGNSVLLIAYNADNYVWTPPTGLNTTIGDSVYASPTVTTVYTVTGTNAAGCSNDTTITVRLSALGVDEISLISNVSVYPNPNKGEFVLEVNDPSVSDLTVFIQNMLGETMSQKTLKKHDGRFVSSFDISDLAVGMYLIRVVSDNKVTVRSIVLQK